MVSNVEHIKLVRILTPREHGPPHALFDIVIAKNEIAGAWLALYRRQVLRIVLNNKLLFWILLAVPAAIMLGEYQRAKIIAMDMLGPTGEWSARFMIIAMMLSPLVALIGQRRWLIWLVQRRRALGVASFGYAVLHLVFYTVDMGNVDDILAEFWALGIWTGWVAMLLLVPLALSSNEASVRRLKAGWKSLQRLVYPVAVLVLVHWIFIHNDLAVALIHFIPLVALIAARYFRSTKHQPQGAQGA